MSQGRGGNRRLGMNSKHYMHNARVVVGWRLGGCVDGGRRPQESPRRPDAAANIVRVMVVVTHEKRAQAGRGRRQPDRIEYREIGQEVFLHGPGVHGARRRTSAKMS